MFLRTELIEERKFVGYSKSMSLIDDMTFNLWSEFRPKVNEINYRIKDHFISLQVYEGVSYFSNFQLSNVFNKYVLVEVSEYEDNDFEQITIADTLYAVFLHKGGSIEFSNSMNYIMTNWLPNSEFELADAPHFEVLDHRYKRENPESQEEIWVPIQKR